MNPTAPGVIIRELDSGSRTIVGVATSITAFIGRARQGPVDSPVLINNYGDYQRIFGGLDRDSSLSYSTRQFFLNGGSQAVIVRLTRDVAEAAEVALPEDVNVAGTLTESAAGSGGSRIRVTVADNNGRDVTIEEVVSNANGQDVVVRRQAFNAPDLAQLNAQFANNNALVERVDTGGGADFASLPDPGAYLLEGTPGSHVSHCDLPNSNDAFVVTDDDQDEDGNDIAVSIYHSNTSDAVFTIILEARQGDGTYNEIGRVDGTNLNDVAAAVGNTAANVTVTDPSGLPARPNEVFRQHLAGGTNGVSASVQLGVGGMRFHSANPGSWGNRLRLSVDHTTSNANDNSLFNLTVELLNANDEVDATEIHRNISVAQGHARRVDNVLSQQSDLIRWNGALPVDRPAVTATPVQMTSGADGPALTANEFDGNVGNKEGIFRLEDADMFNIMVVPPLTTDPEDAGADIPIAVWESALNYCRQKRAMLIIDPPNTWRNPTHVLQGMGNFDGLRNRNSVMYFPRMRSEDPLRENILETYTTSGAIAGLLARTDGQSGVWVSAGGTDAQVVGAREFTYPLTEAEVGQLNPIAVNCLQRRPGAGRVSWGVRTLVGDDARGSEWKYLAPRRLTLFIEETLYRATQWAVFMNNDEALWQALRVSIDTFMEGLMIKGAFSGTDKTTAYSVKCDAETTPPADRARGIVNVEVGFRPVFPAEFVVINIRQLTGQ